MAFGWERNCIALRIASDLAGQQGLDAEAHGLRVSNRRTVNKTYQAAGFPDVARLTSHARSRREEIFDQLARHDAGR